MRITSLLLCIKRVPKSFSNFPESYIKKHTEFIEWQSPNMPHYRRKPIRFRIEPYWDMYRPWEEGFKVHNAPNVHQPKIYVEPIRHFYFFKGDRVEVIRGKDKGKQGFVNYVVKERNWVFVEGLNVRRSLKYKTDDFPGMFIAEEMPLLVPRDVQLVDPSDMRATTIKWKYTQEGKLVRVSERTQRIIPIPNEAFATHDYISPEAYIDKPKDTPPEEVQKVTFYPEIKTFEMEIMEKNGVIENRVPRIMFWY